MPSYSAQTWADGDPTTPIDADRLTHMETGIEAAVTTAVAAIPSSAMAGPGAGGVATVDATATVEQTPKAHTHPTAFQDSDGTVYQVNQINGRFGVGAITVTAGVLTINAVPADVSVKRVAQVSGADPSAANTTTIVNLLTLGMVASDAFDFDLELWIRSSAAAGAKVQVQGPHGATPSTFFGQFFAPREFLADGTTRQTANSDGSLDVSLFRYTPISIPSNGPQHIGGFPAARTSSADGNTTSGSAAITSATAAFNAVTDVGAVISGTGIPAGTTIIAVADATHATLSANATATATTVALTVNTLGWVCTKMSGYCALGSSGSAGNFTVGFAQANPTNAQTSAVVGPSKLMWARAA